MNRSCRTCSVAVAVVLLAASEAALMGEAADLEVKSQPTASRIADVDYPLSVSSDGRHVTEIGDGGNLVIRDLKSRKTLNLTRSYYPELVMAAVFSPDGGRIAYSWHNRDDFDDLRVIASSGSEPRVLYRDSEGRSVTAKDWSSDGSQLLAVLRRTDLKGEIVTVAISDGSLRRLAPKLVFDKLPGRMAFSSKGQSIAYDVRAEGRSPQHDIFVLPEGATRPVPLVQDLSDDVLLGWSPNGNGILFASDRRGTVDIFFLPLSNDSSSGSPRLLKRDVGQLNPLGFSRDGSYYYGVTRCTCNVYVAKLGAPGERDQAPRRVATAFRRTGVDWAPNGKHLAFVAPAPAVLSDSWTLAVSSVDEGTVRRFPIDAHVLHQLRPLWSPDGRFILAKGWDSRAYPRESVFKVEVETGEVTTIVSTPSVWKAGMIEWVDWSADGKSILFMKGTLAPGASLKIVTRDLESGHEREILQTTNPPYFYGLATSPDGHHLALGVWDTKQKRSTLKILPVAGGEFRELAGVPLPKAVSPPSWTPDSRDLIYQSGDQFWRVSIDGGKPSPISGAGPLTMNRAGLSVHPDGRRIAFVAEETAEREVWVVKNLTLQ